MRVKGCKQLNVNSLQSSRFQLKWEFILPEARQWNAVVRIVSEVSHVKKFTHYTNGMEVMCVRADGCSYVLV